MQRRFAPLLLILTLWGTLGLAVPSAADEGDGPDGKPPAGKNGGAPRPAPRPAIYGIEKLQQEIDALQVRLARLSEQANKDPREREIERYRAYDLDRFQKLKKRVRIKKLLDFVFDTEAPFESVRMNAVKAMTTDAARLKDPDLSTARKGSGQSPRAAFCQHQVIKHLRDDDQRSRLLADRLLKGLWGTPSTLLGPENYKPQKKFSKTWTPALNDWKKYFRRR